MNGIFFDPATRSRVRYFGVAFQKQGIAAGNFTNGEASGAVRILPGTNFYYPGSEDAGLLTRTSVPGSSAEDPVETPAAFDSTAASGSYSGVIFDGNGSAIGSLEGVRISLTGVLSGTLALNERRFRFRDMLGSDGGDVRIDLGGGEEAILVLRLTAANSGGYGLEGELQIDGASSVTYAIDPTSLPPAVTAVTYAIDAQRRADHNRSDRSPHEGPYTVAVRAPDSVDFAVEPGGDGYGAMNVTLVGTCRGLVVLADGTRVSLGGHVGDLYPDGIGTAAEWSFYKRIYGGVPKGYVAGKLYFRSQPGISDLDGEWHWVKHDGALPANRYPNGFDVARPVVGNRYTAPGPGERAMSGLADNWWNLWLRFAGPDLSTLDTVVVTELDRAATWNTANRIVYYGPDRFVVNFNRRNGLLTGRYLDIPNGIRIPFGGILLQEQDLVTGSYFTREHSGLFGVEARR